MKYYLFSIIYRKNGGIGHLSFVIKSNSKQNAIDGAKEYVKENFSFEKASISSITDVTDTDIIEDAGKII